jgi:hypothetical protein
MIVLFVLRAVISASRADLAYLLGCEAIVFLRKALAGFSDNPDFLAGAFPYIFAYKDAHFLAHK